jgi:hypothetical protein
MIITIVVSNISFIVSESLLASSVVRNAIFSHVGVVSFVVAFVVGEMMASAATMSRREVDERRKCGPLAT